MHSGGGADGFSRYVISPCSHRPACSGLCMGGMQSNYHHPRTAWRLGMIFHRAIPAIICIVIFFVLMWFGFFKLIFWHYPRFYFTGNRQSYRFIYHYSKALDQSACAGAFGGLSDETISNRAGRHFLEHGWKAPWWAIFTKRLTDKWERDHIFNSIEPLRPDIDEGA